MDGDIVCSPTVPRGQAATFTGTFGSKSEYVTLKLTKPSGAIRGLAAQRTSPFEVSTPEVLTEAGVHKIELFDPKHGPGWGKLLDSCTFEVVG